jgi:glutamate dehydrogenase
VNSLADTEAEPPRGATSALEAVVARAGELHKGREELIARFAAAYLHRLPDDSDVSADTVCDEVLGLYDFIDVRSEPIAVRAFNPPSDDIEAPGTVIEVNVDDGPFLVDSIRNELAAHGLGVSKALHPVIGVQRDEHGRLSDVRPARASEKRESVQHWVLERRLFEADLPALEGALRQVLVDVEAAVRDFDAMLGVIPRMIELTRRGRGHFPDGDIEESVAFLEWLRDDNFVFLGYREYELSETSRGRAIGVVDGSGLGILAGTGRSKWTEPTLLSELSPQLAARYEDGEVLVISKTNQLSTVHRRARMDYVGVRIVGPHGKTIGEARLLGLFTSKAYMERAARTPVLRRKLDELAAAEDLIEGSHDHKAVVSLFESFPKDDLFALPVGDLRRLLTGLLDIGETTRVRFFVRRDLIDRTARLLVAMPAERYSTSLAKQLEDLFLDRFNGESVDFNLSLEADEIAYLHFKVWVDEGEVPDITYGELEAAVRSITRSWADRLADVLSVGNGPAKAREMVRRWAPLFPDYYKTSTDLGIAAGDLKRIDEMARSDQPFVVGIQNETEGPEALTRVALYGSGKRPLFELIPALEDLGLQVVEEVPTRLTGPEDLFVHDFGVLGPDGRPLDLEWCGERVSQALTAVWRGAAETDSLNRLLLVSGLDHTQVAILRGYRTYWRRVSPLFTVSYVTETLATYAGITERLIQLFEMRFKPGTDASGFEAAHYELAEMLDDVPSLDQDRILRGFLSLIEATVRTSAYRADRTALSFKFRSSEVPNMPAPIPFAEVFVVAPEMEGIHLRAGPVARGGIRWSDRREDYRTEVLGLVKAQITKNSVIVPTGAKGGFVLRRPPTDPSELHEAVTSAYTTFIRGLLDVTDNLSNGQVVHPEGVRIHDDDDPYLVVAADKGTARFSDLANQIAREYDYWLEDAFASGGSTGYDHKALGITARGAWKSLERHLLELGVDPNTTPFTAAGIGDMSGDVFGNGMLVSQHIKLVAAFDHRHIFIDPDPSPEASFAERKRLFELAGSSWADYDRELISSGGGVFSRAAKKISLSPQAQTILGTEAEAITPAELIQIILRAPVDVLWNGGIGTYVKATHESNEAVEDKTNDTVRVDASQLRCKVVVEGGNLGVTQRGRIEYALLEGRVNTDFIDNSGGVNCSDREVNLKILTSLARSHGLMDREECDEILERVANDVIERILHDNFEQAQRVALEEATSVSRMDSYEQLMVKLEDDGLLTRKLEALPDTEEMSERSRAGTGMTRPELGVVLAYAKRSLADSLLTSDITDDLSFIDDVFAYFPDEVSTRFGDLVPEHPLLSELVATIVASDVVDTQGSTFVSQLASRTGASAYQIVRAHRLAQQIAHGPARREEIERLFGLVDVLVWTEAINTNDRLISGLTRFYLGLSPSPDAATVENLAEGFQLLEEATPSLGPPSWVADREEHARRFAEAGFPGPMALRLAILGDLIHAPGILEVAERSGRSVIDVGRAYFLAGHALQLDNLARVLRGTNVTSSWRRWARQTIEDDLIGVWKRVTERVLLEAREGQPGDDAVDSFLASHAHALKRVLRLAQSLDSDHDLASLMVVIRQIESLAT